MVRPNKWTDDCAQEPLSQRFSLSLKVTSEEFRAFFEQFGAILDSVVMFDRETKNSRGFGFVTFVDPVSSPSL